MKFAKASAYHIASECGRYFVSVATTGQGRVTYYAVRLFRGSHVIGIERGLRVADEAACAEARMKLRRLCAEDAGALEGSK